MDTAKTITHVSLCAGYGGIDLGLKRAIPSLRTIAVSEIEAFACTNLVAKMEAGLLDPAPIWTDLKTFPWADFHGCVDILSGGYPCQPFSAAGKRLGAEDPRHLWPHISAGIAAMRPSCCFFENVEGHISLGLPDVIEDLAGLGYRTTWGIFSASEVGAPHQRKRVFILAYRHGERGQLPDWWRVAAEQVPVGDGEAWRDGSAKLANAGCSSIWQRAGGQPEGAGNDHARGQVLATAWPSRPGEQQHWWEPPRVVANTERATNRSQAAGNEADWQDAERSASGLGGSGDLLADTASTGSGSQGGNAVHQGWNSSDAWAASVSQDTERQAGAAIADDQSAGRDGGELGNAMLSGSSPERPSGRQQDGLGQPSDGTMGHPNSPRPQERPRQQRAGLQGADADGGEAAERQTQPSLGRDADGPADWLDDAELFTTCDNRTDELRLLGNGVVPATAERAFRVLFSELTAHNTTQPHT